MAQYYSLTKYENYTINKHNILMNYKMQSINNGVYQQTLFVTNLFTKFQYILNDVDKQD